MRPGNYNVELTKAAQIEGKYGPCIRFEFKIIDPEFFGFVVSGITSNKLVEGTKLYSYLKCLSLPLSSNENLYMSTLHGQKCIAKVGLWQDPNHKRAFWNVVELYPSGTVSIKSTEWKEPVTVTRNQTRRFLMRGEDESSVQ
jgi:hypothetical protein